MSYVNLWALNKGRIPCLPRFKFAALTLSLFLAANETNAALPEAITETTNPSPQTTEPLMPVPLTGQKETTLEANYVERNADKVHAKGNVVIQHELWTAQGESLDYDLMAERLKSTQPITLINPALTIKGECVDLNLQNRAGTVDKASVHFFATPRAPARYFSAEKLTLHDENHATLNKVQFSGCPGPDPDWWIESKKITLDQSKGIGEAHDAALYFKGVPLFVTPWMDFSLTGQRKSGLLLPTFGTSSERGFEFQTPIYLNLAPNYDATLTPRYMTKRGLQLNSQFRFLTPHQKGEMDAEWLPNDSLEGTSRYLFSIKDTAQIRDSMGFSFLRLNLNKVSDERYFVDFADRVSSTSQGTLPREIDWTKGFNAPLDTSIVGRFRFQRFQALQTQPQDMPYERTPQFNLSTNTPLKGIARGLSLYSESEVARFRQAILPSVDRMIFYPQLRYNHRTPATQFDANVGANGRLYRDNGSTTQIWTPITSLDGRLFIEPDKPSPYLPMLEPRAYYVYIPYRDQSGARIIDSAPFAAEDLGLFSINDFTGSDRINDANRLTLAMNAHWKHPTRDTERLVVGIAQRFSFQTPQISPGDLKSKNPLFVYARGEMGPGFNWTTTASYDVDTKLVQQVQMGFQYRPTDSLLFNSIYRYQRDAQLTAQPNENWKQLDFSGQWTLSNQWKTVWRWNYDLENKKTLEALGGLEYTRGCWGIRAVGQHLVTSSTSSNHAFFIQLELEGLGQLGANPLEALRRSIPGYVDNSTASQSQFNSR
ncbi:MAG: LPS assembly protein LptD [Pseudomonadota bacterium]